MYLPGRNGQPVFTELWQQLFLGGDQYPSVGLQYIDQLSELCGGDAALMGVVIGVEGHQAQDEERFAFGKPRVLQHGGVGLKPMGMQIGQFVCAIVENGAGRLAVSAQGTGRQPHIGERMGETNHDLLHLVIVIVKVDRLHTAQL